MTAGRKNPNRTLFKPRPAGTLKAAMAALVEASGGTVRAADLLGLGQAQVQRCSDAAEPRYELKLSHVRTLERDCGQPIVTAYLATEARCALVPLTAMADAPLGADMARFGERASKLFAAYVAASADQRLTSQEAGELKAEVQAVMSALAAMLPDLEEIMGATNV